MAFSSFLGGKSLGRQAPALASNERGGGGKVERTLVPLAAARLSWRAVPRIESTSAHTSDSGGAG